MNEDVFPIENGGFFFRLQFRPSVSDPFDGVKSMVRPFLEGFEIPCIGLKVQEMCTKLAFLQTNSIREVDKYLRTFL